MIEPSRPRAWMVSASTALGLVLLPNAAPAQTTRIEGSLPARAETDTVTVKREHTFTVGANRLVEIRLTSSDFDTVLEVVAPNGRELQNDDSGNGTDSFVQYSTATAGDWRAIVSAFSENGGDYVLSVTLGAAPTMRELPTESLTANDSISAKGLRYKRYTFALARRSTIAAEMTSAAFPPSLILISPSGRRYTSETDGGSEDVTRADVSGAEAGTWQVIAAHSSESDAGEVTGPFSLVWMESPSDDTSFSQEGELTETDPQQITGEYYHEYDVAVSGDASLNIEVVSEDFDGYLAVRSPSGEWFRNDDGDNGSNPSLTLDPEAGTWRVIVTTYQADTTGSYRLATSRPAVRVRR